MKCKCGKEILGYDYPSSDDLCDDCLSNKKYRERAIIKNQRKIKPVNYSIGVMCLTCGNNGNCELGKHVDKGCCDLYTDGGYEID